MHRADNLHEGFHVFYAAANEDSGWEQVILSIQRQINEAEKVWDIEFLSNSKVDADGGGGGRNLFFGYQCCVLKKKK